MDPHRNQYQLCRMGGRPSSLYVKTLLSSNRFVFPPVLPHRFKAQQRGSESEATNRNTGKEMCLRISQHCVSHEELVTRTGFEPMLKA